jgi:hypothetical protein
VGPRPALGVGSLHRQPDDQRPLRDHPDEAGLPDRRPPPPPHPPAEGYYEWQKLDAAGRRKQPWFLSDPDGAPLAFAGLYEWRKDPDLPPDDPAAWLWTCTIMTTTASDALGHVHDRSPVIVPADLLDAWLDPALTDPDEIRALLAAMPEPRLTPRPVGRAVGSVRNDGPHLIGPGGNPSSLRLNHFTSSSTGDDRDGDAEDDGPVQRVERHRAERTLEDGHVDDGEQQRRLPEDRQVEPPVDEGADPPGVRSERRL